uniref:Uncharacterized protein n=1 Tax=viral metagenome TaxID=1070528 RepID=A0A6C0CKZ9_9ZZZZ
MNQPPKSDVVYVIRPKKGLFVNKRADVMRQLRYINGLSCKPYVIVIIGLKFFSIAGVGQLQEAMDDQYKYIYSKPGNDGNYYVLSQYQIKDADHIYIPHVIKRKRFPRIKNNKIGVSTTDDQTYTGQFIYNVPKGPSNKIEIKDGYLIILEISMDPTQTSLILVVSDQMPVLKETVSKPKLPLFISDKLQSVIESFKNLCYYQNNIRIYANDIYLDL